MRCDPPARAASRPSSGGRARRRGPRAGVQQQERARCRRCSWPARREAGLAERRRLLVAGERRDRDRAAEELAAVSPSSPMRVGPRAARRRARRRARAAPRPRRGVDVEEERPAGVRDVGAWTAPAGAVPPVRRQQQERIHRPERQLAALGSVASAGHGVEDRRDLRPAEVGVEGQPGPLPEQRLVARGPEPLAGRRGDPRLPDDRVGDRLARRAVPDDRRLALVGDPDGGDPIRAARPPPRPPRATASWLDQICSGSWVTWPGDGNCCSNGCWALRPGGRPARTRSRATTSCPGRGRGSAGRRPRRDSGTGAQVAHGRPYSRRAVSR